MQHGFKAVVIDTNDARYPKVHTASEALRIAKRMLDLEMVVLFHSDASDVRYAIEQFTEQTSVGRTHITDDPSNSVEAFAKVSIANSHSIVETYSETL